MKTRKLRRTGSPCHYGTTPVATGDVLDFPAGVARELVDGKEGWEFVPHPHAADAAEPVQTSAPKTTSRPKADEPS